jgi:hypothetical protein
MMSVDDKGTYVLQTAGPEFRIAQVTAVENFYDEQDPESGQWFPNCEAIREAYAKSKVYNNLEDAWDDATSLELLEETQFGVNLMREFEHIKYSTIEAFQK